MYAYPLRIYSSTTVPLVYQVHEDKYKKKRKRKKKRINEEEKYISTKYMNMKEKNDRNMKYMFQITIGKFILQTIKT